jgi:transcriptional regulator with XRE-family HTH domain
MLGVSKTTVSAWRNAHKAPSLESVRKVSDLFEVDPIRLVYSPFTELIENELGDVERFRRVEEKLRKGAMRPGLPKAVRLAEVAKHPKT